MKKWISILFTTQILLSLAYSNPLFGVGTKQDTVQKKRNGFIYFPIIFYTPETELVKILVEIWSRGSGKWFLFMPHRVNWMLGH